MCNAGIDRKTFKSLKALTLANPLIIAALKDEIRGLKSKSAIECTIHFKPATFYSARCFDKDFDLLLTGIGAERTKKALDQALADRTPSAILCVGFVGGASPVAGLGTLVLGDKIVDEQSEKVFSGDKELLEKAKHLCEGKKWSCKVGGIVTVDRIVSNPHDKADLGAVHGVIAIDMEAAAVAEAATERQIPFLAVKAILDPVEMTLPNLQNCIESTGETSPFLVMEHLMHQPGDVMKLPQIQYCATQAREALAQFLEGWLRQLV